jgi:hypothetical protein
MDGSLKLVVTVQSANNLKNRKSKVPGNKSDPYVRICLDGDLSRALGTTKAIQNNLSPTWGERLVLNVGAAIVAGGGAPPTMLTFVIMDESIGADKEMGRADVPFAHIMKGDAPVDGDFPVSTGGSLSLTVAIGSEAKTLGTEKPAKKGFSKNDDVNAAWAMTAAGFSGVAMKKKVDKKGQKNDQAAEKATSTARGGGGGAPQQRTDAEWFPEDSDSGSERKNDGDCSSVSDIEEESENGEEIRYIEVPEGVGDDDGVDVVEIDVGEKEPEEEPYSEPEDE